MPDPGIITGRCYKADIRGIERTATNRTSIGVLAGLPIFDTPIVAD